MLLQLENTDQANINKLLLFAKENHLQLSLVDDNEENYKKIVNDVNNKEDKTIGFKQNSNNKSLFSPIKLRPPEK